MSEAAPHSPALPGRFTGRGFTIRFLAYLAAALAAWLVLAVPDGLMPSRPYFMHALVIMPATISVVALLPFLGAKYVMDLCGQDGLVAHILAGGSVAGFATSVLFQEPVWAEEVWPVGRFFVLAGLVAGAVYWGLRRGLAAIWKGKTA